MLRSGDAAAVEPERPTPAQNPGRGEGTARVAPEPEYLSLRALVGYSSLSLRTLRGYLHHPSRPLPHYRVGGKILVRRSEFDTWMRAFRAVVANRVDALVADVLAGL